MTFLSAIQPSDLSLVYKETNKPGLKLKDEGSNSDTQGMYFWAHHCFDVLSGGLSGVVVTLSVLLGCSSFGGLEGKVGVI